MKSGKEKKIGRIWDIYWEQRNRGKIESWWQSSLHLSDFCRWPKKRELLIVGKKLLIGERNYWLLERNCPGDIKCDNKITGGLRSCGMVLSFTPPMRLQFPRLGLSGYLAAADCQRELLLCALCCVLCSVFCVLCVPRSHVVCIWQDPSSRLTSGAHVAGLAALVMEAEIGNRPQRPQSMPQPRPPSP